MLVLDFAAEAARQAHGPINVRLLPELPRAQHLFRGRMAARAPDAFRPLTADAQVAVVMRALVSQGQIFEPAYRISLPQLLSGDVRNAVRRPKNAITLVEEGRIQSAAPDAWQRLEVTARLNRITLTLSEVFVGTYHVDGFTGYLLLTSKKGVVQLRNVADRRSRLSNSRPALSSYYPMRRRTQYVKPTIEELHRNQ